MLAGACRVPLTGVSGILNSIIKRRRHKKMDLHNNAPIIDAHFCDVLGDVGGSSKEQTDEVRKHDFPKYVSIAGRTYVAESKAEINQCFRRQ